MENHILYEDKDILVCRKPAGTAVQTARLAEPDMESLLKTYLARSGKPDLYIIHRLDQPVEGIIVFAKTKKAASSLGGQLQHMEMAKTYLAVVCIGQRERLAAQSAAEAGTQFSLVDYLKKDNLSNSSKAVKKEDSNAKKAELAYQFLNTVDTSYGYGLALLRIQLQTGRHHQIRVQMSHARMPLAGDVKYADADHIAFFKKLAVRDIALCACGLRFQHPVSLQKLEYHIAPAGYAFSLVLPEIAYEKP